MAKPAASGRACSASLNNKRPAMKEVLRIFALLTVAVTFTGCGSEPAEVEQPAAVSHDTPYAVGSTTLFLHDDTRPYDSVAGIDEGIRTLITEIWYPVDHTSAASGDYRRATYGDYVFGDPLVHRLMMQQTTFLPYDAGHGQGRRIGGANRRRDRRVVPAGTRELRRRTHREQRRSLAGCRHESR